MGGAGGESLLMLKTQSKKKNFVCSSILEETDICHQNGWLCVGH